MTPRTRMVLNLADDQPVSLDGGRVRLRLRKRSGRLSTLILDMDRSVKVDQKGDNDAAAAQPAPVQASAG